MTEPTTPGPDSQPLVGASEAAAIMGVELSTFSHLRRREEVVEGSKFPKPMAVLRCGPIWKTTEIQKFAKRYVAPRPGPKPVAEEKSAPKPIKKVAAKPVAVKAAATNGGKVNGVKKAPTAKKTVAKKVAVKV